MIVDAQVHLWQEEAPERPWPLWGRKVAHLPWPLTYPKMLALMDEAGVERAIIVPPSWEGDHNDYALQAAREHPTRFAVMGRIALDDPVVAKLLPRWREQKGMLGIRLTFNYGKQSWISDGTSEWFWAAAEETGLPVMLHPPHFMREVAKIAQKHPRLKLIIDQFGLSRQIAEDGTIAQAIEETASLAPYPNVSVKLATAPTFSRETYPFRDMYPHIRRLIEAYGPRRCFWGTDVSISFDKCSYRERVTHFTEELDFLTSEDKKLVMGEAILDRLGWPV